MRCRLVLLSFALLFAAPVTAAPVEVSVAQLLRDPDRYAMQTVHVTGQVDNCAAFGCDLCPPEMTPGGAGRCLEITFSGYRAKNDGDAGADAAARTAAGMDRLFRFATVRLEAVFDPSCLTNKSYNDDGSPQLDSKGGKMLVVCNDRAIALPDARVMEVLSRKSVRNGLIGGFHFGPLVDASPAIAAEVRAVFDDTLADKSPERLRIFQMPSLPTVREDKAIDRDVLICECSDVDCSSEWPTRYVGGFDSPGNPFTCDEVRRRKNVWIVLPRDN